MEQKETKINGKDKLMPVKKERGGKRKRTKKEKEATDNESSEDKRNRTKNN